MAQFPAVIALSTLNGSTGFRIDGEAAGNYAGFSVSSAGDVNGDGFPDLLIGAESASPNGTYSGASYVVFGKASGFASTLELSSLTGSNGFQINGESAYSFSGYSVAGAGDINGDGFADFIIGAPFPSPTPGTYAGTAYVVFGKASGFSANLELSALNGSSGFQINGELAGDLAGISVSSAGDINGDGFADFIVGASGAVPNGAGSGAAYVVFGKASGFSANLDLSSLNGSNGFQINGEAAGNYAGIAVSAADINGDGFSDLLIGAPFAAPNGVNSGAAYVVFGKASGFAANLDLSSLNGSNGFQINGESAYSLAGYSIASAGDVNGDGIPDIIIGARGANGKAGAAYVIFGKASGWGATFDLSSLNGTNGFKITGEASGDYAGWSVASAGDVNGDGFGDVIIGAPRASPNGVASSGAAYVVFGKASGFPASISLSSLDGTNGFKIDGVTAGDQAGHSVAGAGDINDDGFADVLVGADRAGPNGTDSGASYVVFGGKPDSAVNRTGTNASQTLAGGDFNDTLSGLGGNDTLYGHGGNDTLNGGAGIDTAVFSGMRSAYTITRNGPTITVAGPDGTDTLTGVEKARFDDQTVLLGQGPTRTDFNSDLDSDILWQNSDGTPAIWLMNGLTLLNGATAGSNPGTTWQIKIAGDFNGDGKADILWQSADGSPAIWFMNGTTLTSGGLVSLNPGTTWNVVGSGDFNGDGMSDILWQGVDGTPAIWLMNGTTLSSGAAFSNPGTAWHIIGAGDFNGDGKSDILWQSVDGTPAIWLMNGTSVLSSAALSNPGAAWHLKAAGDFNGDGESDLLWQNNNGAVAIWLMNGTTFLSGGLVGSNPGTTWQVVGAGDFNGDGKADILFQNTNGTPAVWLMNGTTFLSGAALPNPGPTWHVLTMGS